MRRIGLAFAVAVACAAATGCGPVAAPFPAGGPTPTPTFTPTYGPGPDGGLLWALLDRDPMVAGTAGEAEIQTVRVASMTTAGRIGLGVGFVSSMALHPDGEHFYLAEPDLGLVSFREADSGGAEYGSQSLSGARDVALSAAGTYLFAAGVGTAMAITYQQEVMALALGTGVTANAVAADPSLDAQFALAMTGSSGTVLLGNAGYGALVETARTTLVGSSGCTPSPADVAFGPSGGLFVWDEPCDAIETLPDDMTQATSDTATFAGAGDTSLASNDQLLAPSGSSAFALGATAELALDFSTFTTDSAGGLATAPTTQAANYDGTVLWIATRPATANAPATLARYDVASHVLTPAVYAFTTPGWYVRDLAYLDRPPSLFFSGPSTWPWNGHVFTGPPGKPIDIQVSATDPDGEAATVTMSSGVGSFDALQGIWSGTTPACSKDASGTTVSIPFDVFFQATAGRWTTPDRFTIQADCPIACDTGPILGCNCGCTIADRPTGGGGATSILGLAALGVVVLRRRAAVRPL